MDAWQTITTAVLGNAIALSVLGWLAKSLVENRLQQDTKRFELELAGKANTAIERLRSDLSIKAMEHQVRFSRLHEKRATVIAELNGLIVESLWEAESFLSPAEWVGEPKKDEKHRAAMTKLVELYRFFDKHRIYLPEDLCKSVDYLINDVRSHVIKFGVYLDVNDSIVPAEVRKEKHEAWFGGWKAIREQVPPVRKKLEDEFRTLLGAA